MAANADGLELSLNPRRGLFLCPPGVRSSPPCPRPVPRAPASASPPAPCVAQSLEVVVSGTISFQSPPKLLF